MSKLFIIINVVKLLTATGFWITIVNVVNDVVTISAFQLPYLIVYVFGGMSLSYMCLPIILLDHVRVWRYATPLQVPSYYLI